MADPTPVAVTPGMNSSEYFLTKVMIALGAITTVAGAVLGAMPSTVGGPYLPIAMVVVGLTASFLKARGYSAGRTELKVAAAGVVVAQNSEQLIAIVTQVLAAVKAKETAAAGVVIAEGQAAGTAAVAAPVSGAGVNG